MRPYLGRQGGRDPDPREVNSYAMRMVLDAFLAYVLNAKDLTHETAHQNLQWLLDSGLYEAMRGGSFSGAVAGSKSLSSSIHSDSFRIHRLLMLLAQGKSRGARHDRVVARWRATL